MAQPHQPAVPRPSFDRILSKIAAVKPEHTITQGPGYALGFARARCRCPAHEDRTPSLEIVYDPARARSWVRCWAGCAEDAVFRAAGIEIRDLFDTPTRQPGPRVEPRPVAEHAGPTLAQLLGQHTKPALGAATGPRRQTAIYTYRDERGIERGEQIRLETPHEHGVDKTFRQRVVDSGGRWRWGGFERVYGPLIYRLVEVRAAIDAGASEIWVPEGEKDADRAWTEQLPATCNPGGAGHFGPGHAAWLIGARRVVVVADNDAAGYRHAVAVRRAVRRVGITDIAIVTAAAGKDLSDHFDAGHRRDQFQPVAAEILRAAAAELDAHPRPATPATDPTPPTIESEGPRA